MTKQILWYGFLEAGQKSSPVVIDHSIETGEKNTIFIYNHNKQEIVKYNRELVEHKLRELTAEEKQQEAALKKGFMEAVKKINNKIPKTFDSPPKNKPTPKIVEPSQDEPEVDISDSDLDDDVWDDSDE